MKKVLLLCAALSVGACTDSETETKEMKIATPQPPVVVNKTQAEIDKEKEDKRWEELNKHGFSKKGVMKDAKPFTNDSQMLDY